MWSLLTSLELLEGMWLVPGLRLVHVFDVIPFEIWPVRLGPSLLKLTRIRQSKQNS
jgi:hypothetical protein